MGKRYKAMSTNVLGNVVAYDPENKMLSFKMAFVLPSIEEDIEKLLEKPGLHKFSFSSVKESGTYGQQKYLFQTLSRILCALLKRKHTSKELAVFYVAMAKKFFPIRKYMLGDEEIAIPAISLSDLSKDERGQVTEEIQEFYSYLNVDFD